MDFVINGADAFDWSGYSVSDVGDINGDGLDDLIIGSPLAGFKNVYSNGWGESYVVFGSTAGFGASFELSAINGSNGIVINGIGDFSASGHSVSAAGDINGDGVDDLIIGAPRALPNGVGSGESYVVFGSTAGFATSIELSALNGANGFVLNGIDFADKSGQSVACRRRRQRRRD